MSHLEPPAVGNEQDIFQNLPNDLNSNILLQPTVLDIVFPRLPFKDIKNCRSVCKKWEIVANPIIGKKDLKLVEFSTINYEDFLKLKSAIGKTPSKSKLFKGFQLKWEEMGTMIFINFLSAFNLNKIKVYGWNIMNSSSNLKDLLQPALKTLEDIQLMLVWEPSASCSYFTVHLDHFSDLDFSDTILTKLNIQLMKIGQGQISHEQVEDIFQTIEMLSHSVCSFLEDFELEFAASLSKPEKNGFTANTIQLPVFTKLNKLKLNLKCEDNEFYLYTITDFDFCHNLQNLKHLEILDTTLYMMTESLQKTNDHQLKTLKIFSDGTLMIERDEEEDNEELYANLYKSFPNLEEFSCQDSELGNLKNGGSEILWTRTMKKLEVQGEPEYFDFRHLTKLERLVYTMHGEINEEHLIEDITAHIRLHLDHLPLLKYFRVSFKNIELTVEQMDLIHAGIPPKFRAIYHI